MEGLNKNGAISPTTSLRLPSPLPTLNTIKYLRIPTQSRLQNILGENNRTLPSN